MHLLVRDVARHTQINASHLHYFPCIYHDS